MRHGSSNNKRQRNRGGQGRRGGGQPRMQVFDSNGPDVRIRGTAYQVTEKYLALAKDAAASGDDILAQSYLQHAEHYQRVINSWEEQGGKRPADAKTPTDVSGEEAVDGNSTEEAAVEKKKPAPKKLADNDDLGLPSSILGDKVETEAAD